jgi:hypothetical protein
MRFITHSLFIISDLINITFQYLPYSEQLKLHNHDAFIYNKHLYRIIELDCESSKNLNQKDIELPIYSRLKSIDLVLNRQITSLNHISSTLNNITFGSNSPLELSGIVECKSLLSIACSSNEKLTFLNNFKNLQSLDLTNNSSIAEDGISELDLLSINCGYKPKLTNLNHMKNLNIVQATGSGNIYQLSIYKLSNLVEIDCSRNPHITDLNIFPNLKIASI